MTLNTCYTGTVESIGGYFLEQSVSVRAFPESFVGEAERQSNFSARPRSRFAYQNIPRGSRVMSIFTNRPQTAGIDARRSLVTVLQTSV